MAIYHMSMKTVARAKGKSATAAAAYRAGEKIKDERTGEIFDYSRKLGVVETEIILPESCGKIDRSELWNAAEAAETRKNSTVAREYEIALPAELDAEQRRQLVKDFAGWLVDEYGVAADVAIHQPNRKGDERNHHAHILTSTRRLTAEGFGEKTRELDGRKTEEVNKIRERWEIACNQVLCQKGVNEISRQTLKAQGVERVPEIHVGAAATAMARAGRLSERYQRNQDIKALPDLRAELKGLTLSPDLPGNAPNSPDKTPKLKTAEILSADKAHALLSATAAEYAKKPLAALDASAAAEQKRLKALERSSFAAFVEQRDRPPRKKGLFESVKAYESSLQAERERQYELSAAHSKAQKALGKHTTDTAAERQKINAAALTAAEQKHPEAVAAIKQDKEQKRQEQERRAAERKAQEQERKRGGRSLGR